MYLNIFSYRVSAGLLLLTGFVLLFPFLQAYASSMDPAQLGAVVTVPCRVVSVATGTFGRLIAMVVLLFSAMMLMFGKMSVVSGVTIFVGFGFLFGAEALVNFFVGGDGISCTDIIAAADA